jgi:plasmid stabilization system protein ParE
VTAYVLSEDTDLDLDDIWEYIARDDIEAADRWIGKLFDPFESIGRSPGIGHKREDLTGYTVLFFPLGAYLITYRAVSPVVEIVAGCARYSVVSAAAAWLLGVFIAKLNHCEVAPFCEHESQIASSKLRDLPF